MEQQKQIAVYENKIAGICGAFLFALPGGVVWYLLYRIGFIASISCLIAIVCAMKGYTLFSKKESTFGVIASTVVTVLVMILAWYFCLATDVYEACAAWYANGEIDYAPTFVESLASAYLFLAEPDVCLAYLKDLGMGLIFCVIGCYSNVKSALNAQKMAAAEPAPAQEPTDGATPADEPTEPTEPTGEDNDAVAATPEDKA